MSGFLLDTNVISEIMRPRKDPNVVAWIEATDEDLLFLSVLTIGEIRKGIELHPDATRRARLQGFLEKDVLQRFDDRLLPVDAAICERWGRMQAAMRVQHGQTLPVIDGLLAATAQHHNLTFVTRNMRDVVLTGVSVFNPWTFS